MLAKALVLFSLATSVTEASPPISQESIPEIRFSDHHFSPQTLAVHAGQPLQIKVVNSSRERIEFESFSLNREKVIEPGESVTVRLPALRAGRYDFFDDFHSDVPEGAIVAESAFANIQHPAAAAANIQHSTSNIQRPSPDHKS